MVGSEVPISTLLLTRGGTASLLLCTSSPAILPPRDNYVLYYGLHGGTESAALHTNTGDAGVLTAYRRAFASSPLWQKCLKGSFAIEGSGKGIPGWTLPKARAKPKKPCREWSLPVWTSWQHWMFRASHPAQETRELIKGWMLGGFTQSLGSDPGSRHLTEKDPTTSGNIWGCHMTTEWLKPLASQGRQHSQLLPHPRGGEKGFKPRQCAPMLGWVQPEGKLVGKHTNKIRDYQFKAVTRQIKVLSLWENIFLSHLHQGFHSTSAVRQLGSWYTTPVHRSMKQIRASS